jgi:nitrogen regulatory protein PII 1
MKLVKAVIRPEKEEEVVEALEKEGFVALTKMDVFGRGKQRGIQVGTARYDELAKVLLLLAVEDEDAQRVVETVMESARTGNYGDGKIFVIDLLEAYTIRTGERGL